MRTRRQDQTTLASALRVSVRQIVDWTRKGGRRDAQGRPVGDEKLSDGVSLFAHDLSALRTMVEQRGDVRGAAPLAKPSRIGGLPGTGRVLLS
jgi:hypothetical protein